MNYHFSVAGLKKKILFGSWKEIAGYFDVSVKTCQRWEKSHGLPVHRLADSSKSNIFVYQDEFEEWLKSSLVKKHLRAIPSPADPDSERRRIPKWLLASFPFAAFLILVIFLSKSPPRPADFHIRAGELVILDRKGRELWRYDTGIEGLAGEEEYRERFQKKRIRNDVLYLPLLVIRDLNGDHLPEVIFALHTLNLSDSDSLVILDHRGHLIARVPTGRQMVYGNTTYPDEYNIYGLVIDDLQDDGLGEILLISNQTPFFPTRFLVIDCRGRIQSEYWNSGRISDITVADTDNDGRREVLISGMNNEYRKGFFAVFSSQIIKGGSPQMEDSYTPRGIGRGSERHYVLLPRTDVDQLDHLIDNAIEVKLHKNGNIFVRMRRSGNFYVFNRQMVPVTTLFCNRFVFMHREEYEKKRVTSVLNDDYKQRLLDNILYFNGKNWVNRPPDPDRSTKEKQKKAVEDRLHWEV